MRDRLKGYIKYVLGLAWDLWYSTGDLVVGSTAAVFMSLVAAGLAALVGETVTALGFLVLGAVCLWRWTARSADWLVAAVAGTLGFSHH